MSKPQRRQPKQARALATRAAIFEATARILESDGEAALTTNAIAARAGVSVGTLYEYFADKQAILVAMAYAENERVRARIVAEAAEGLSATRAAIRAQIEILADRPATRRAALKAILDAESVQSLRRETALTGHLIQRPETPDALDSFIMTRAVLGVIRAAVLESSPHLRDPRLEDALVRLVDRYAAPGP
ncbi:TetR/AcrR family transcriptional regulator [Phenylobacterium sp.]|uniref:TetR/AcrR family transcriptional regulator n=1 Tax=Phenylobacterium sp. TaxID=1871053 RepID=UPI0027330F7D|nr:TetR/AcrR family transcriptional regulator [Phenylobacterium sp.]MDP3853474.1 TetR/AcrR family transcriptional regulator [Phenylobacterium sp.]